MVRLNWVRAVVFLLSCCARPAWAIIREWDAGGLDDNWRTAANWDPDGLPAASDDVYLRNGATAIVTRFSTAANLHVLDGGLLSTEDISAFVPNLVIHQSTTIAGTPDDESQITLNEGGQMETDALLINNGGRLVMVDTRLLEATNITIDVGGELRGYGLVNINSAAGDLTNNGLIRAADDGELFFTSWTGGSSMLNNLALVLGGTMEAIDGNMRFQTGLSTSLTGAMTVGTEREIIISGDLAIGAESGALVVSDGGAVFVTGLLSVGSQGIIKGNGNISASMVNSGVVSPGISEGALQVNGNYIESTAGQLQIELGGTTPGAEYDRLLVSGAVHLAGTLQVTTTNTFIPELNDTFDILDWGIQSGTFSTIQLPGLADHLSWNTSQLYTTGVLFVTRALADLNGDGFVGQDDLGIILGSWGQNVPPGEWNLGDSSGDGFVGQDDLNTVLSDWGQGTPPGMVAATPVPEPQTRLLWITGFACCAVAGRLGSGRNR